MINIVIDAMVHVSFLLCICMTIAVTWKCRQSQVRTAFLFAFGVMAIWSIGTLLEVDSRHITGVTNMLFINICYIGICLIPIALLYLGRVILQPEWQPRPVHALFLLIPFASIVMVFTNQFHHLFFVHFSLASSEAVYGAYYYFHSVYSYGCIAAAIVLMLVASIRNSGFFSKQSLLVILGVFTTAVPNILFSFGLAKLPFSISVAAFTLSILCFLVAFVKYRFITTLPITLRHVVDLISDGYMVVDRELIVLTYNKTLKRMVPELESIEPGESLHDLLKCHFSAANYSKFLGLHALSLEKKETVSAEWHTGQNAYISVEFIPILQHNMRAGCIILLKDITKSKQLIEATRAESRYKSEFLSNMSHEIRTPMNAIIGMVTIGKTAADIERKDYCLARIEEASVHLLGIINDVLDISKIEAGKFELSHEDFDFEAMLQRIINVNKIRSDEKKQTLELYDDKAIPQNLTGDDQRLAQVITNLIGNAVKFTPEGGSISLTTKLVSIENNICKVQFDVSDTGIGISPEQQKKLFQSYVQAETETSRKFGGTGLGLTISKKIVEKMGGIIWIKSELGKGATFSFTVHLEKGTQESDLSSIRLLAVDSEADSLACFRDLTQKTGVSCDIAENYEDAMRLVEKNGAYNIYIIERLLPGKTSVMELVKKLKTEPAGAENSVVVLCSGKDWNEIGEEAKAAGVDRFIQKPLSPQAITDLVSDYFGAEKPEGKEAGAEINGIYSGKRILLAEDVEINREIVLAMLEKTSIEIDCAENGVEAVRMFGEAPDRYDMIFMDVQMPEMDGYEATQRIRKIEAELEAKNQAGSAQGETSKDETQSPSMANGNTRRNIPIIAMTANVFREDIEKCLESGMNGHIGKPLAFNMLLYQLNQYLLNQKNTGGERRIKDRRHIPERRLTPDRRIGERRKS